MFGYIIPLPHVRPNEISDWCVATRSAPIYTDGNELTLRIDYLFVSCLCRSIHQCPLRSRIKARELFGNLVSLLTPTANDPVVTLHQI